MKDEELVKKFLSARTVLVVDLSKSYRTNIANTLVDLGANLSDVKMAPNFDRALKVIADNKAEVIISDYNLAKHSGLELIELQKDVYINNPNRTFILCTGNSTESAIAEAVEEDVDSYAIKPFTGEGLRDNIIKALITKLKPSNYYRLVNAGKACIKNQKFGEAKKFLTSALKVGDQPSLAYYYLGTIAETEEKNDQALEFYEKGLECNQIHYKCLLGKFELLRKIKSPSKAYETLKEIAKVFPLSPKKLAALFEMAVYTGNYPDVESYYDLFTALEYRPKSLVKIVSASLITCSMFYLTERENEKAEQVMNRAANAAMRDPKILREIVEKFVEFRDFARAQKFLKLFHPEDQTSSLYHELHFKVADGLLPPEQIINSGRKLIAKGFKSLTVYEILIRRFIERDKIEAAEALAFDAAKIFPDREEFLESFIRKAKSQKQESS